MILAEISDKVNAKVIGWQHNTYERYFKTKGKGLYYYRKLAKKMLPKLDYYVTLTKYDTEEVRKEFGIKVTTIHNPKSFTSIETSNLMSKQFLALGRLVYAKGFDILLNAFKIFMKENKDWNLIIVGEGKERKNLEKQIKKNNLESRVYLEHATNNVKKYFLNSSTFLLPSRWEGFGMVVLEALETGVPVIAFDINAMREIFGDSKAKILVEQNNIEEYAKAMLKIAENDEYRKTLGRNAKERAKLFTIEKISKEWEEILKKVKE